jgi:hypothetical protein
VATSEEAKWPPSEVPRTKAMDTASREDHTEEDSSPPTGGRGGGNVRKEWGGGNF